MISTVNLYYKHLVEANKISDEISDYVLPTKYKS